MKFIGAIVIALVVTLAFRSLVMTVCTVDGKGLEPVFQKGDRAQERKEVSLTMVVSVNKR